MLRPVSKHHHKTGEYEGDNKYDQCRLKIQKAKCRDDSQKSQLANRDLCIHFFPLPGKEINENVTKAKKHKPQPVFHKIDEAIPTITHCGACIIGHIIFNMMHSHMMNMIGIPQMTKKWTNEPKKISAKKPAAGLKKFSMTKTMKHQAKTSF